MNFKDRSFQYAVLSLLALIWGSSFILMKRGLETFDPDEVAAFRMTVALAVLLPIALRNLRTIRGRFMPLFLLGLLGNCIPAFLFALAQTRIPSSLSGMLNSLTSLFTLVLGVLFFGMKAWRGQFVGVILALIGALGLIGYGHLLELSAYGRYSLLIVAASACYGTGVNMVKRYLQQVPSHHITALGYLLTVPFLSVYLVTSTDFVHQVATEPESRKGLLYVAALGIFSTSMAVILFNRLIKETTPVFASAVTYLIPVVAIGWGIADGETVELTHLGYLLLVLAGIYLINKQPGKRG